MATPPLHGVDGGGSRPQHHNPLADTALNLPDPQIPLLKQVIELLHNCRSPNTEVLKEAHKQIQQFNQNLEFNFYLIHTVQRQFDLSQLGHETASKIDDVTRHLAFIILKNNVKRTYQRMPPVLQAQVKEISIQTLGDEIRSLRHMSGVLITSILAQCPYGLDEWPELLPRILQVLEKGKQDQSIPTQLIEGVFAALDKICEDCSDVLELDLSAATRGNSSWSLLPNSSEEGQAEGARQNGRSTSVHVSHRHNNSSNTSGTTHSNENAQPHANPEDSPLYKLLPLFIDYFNYPANPEVKALAVACCNHFIVSRTRVLSMYLEQFITGLFALAEAHYNNTEYEDVQRQVCRALVLLLEIQNDCLEKHMPGIVDYMLYQTQSATKNVAIEACEFWLTLAEQSDVSKMVLRENGRLGRLVPILIHGMKYADDDPILLKIEENDGMEPDNDQDIRPRNAKASKGTIAFIDPDDENEESKEKDDDDFSWNIRKCSAAALDVLSSVFESEILMYVLPELGRLLPSDDWMELESGILVLGAIAEGCTDGIAEHLPGLINQLINSGLTSDKALVRSITCWTLSRYSTWILRTTVESYGSYANVEEARSLFLKPLVMSLLQSILDNSKRVQEAACSAFATLEEEATSELEEYLDEIVNTLLQASQRYQAKNLLILYDAISTLADVIGESLGKAERIVELLNELLVKWDRMPTDPKDPRSKDIFALLECLSSIATAVGKQFQEHSQTVFLRSNQLIARCLKHSIEYKRQQENGLQPGEQLLEPPDKDFMIVGLDLLSGVTEGLGHLVSEFVRQSDPPMAELMLECATDTTPEVRQSAFALMGDLTKASYEHMHPQLYRAVPLLVSNVTKFAGGYANTLISVCNNATWALGEICVNLNRLRVSGLQNIEHLQEALNLIDHFVVQLMEHLSQIIRLEGMQKTLIENTAITIGRLGLLCPVQCSQFVPNFIQHWCMSLQSIRDNEEKYTAFLGLVMMIRANAAILQDLTTFQTLCTAITSWWTPPQDLAQHFNWILHTVIDQMPAEQWETIRTCYLPPAVMGRLRRFYNV